MTRAAAPIYMIDKSGEHWVPADSSTGRGTRSEIELAGEHEAVSMWSYASWLEEFATETADEDTNVLVAITYGANANANLEDFARVEFRYNETESPCPGTSLVPGASLTHRGPYTEIHGSKTHDRIDVLAKPSPGASYLHSRSYELSYDADAAACDENHGPLRILNGVQEHAPKFAGDSSIGYLHEDPAQWISKPQVSFGYGPLERSWNQSGTTGLTFLGRESRPRPG